MPVLIYGHKGDEHALSVQRALISHGVECAIFSSDEFPVESTISIDPTGREWWLKGPLIDSDISKFDVVWNRRNKQAATALALHPDDRVMARDECTKFLRECRLTVPINDQIWINKEDRQRAISAKPAQLALAHSIGLAVPPTLVSNDPVRVRKFVIETGSAIVKALDKIAWEDEQGQVVLPTTTISESDCIDDEAIRGCPMIYQQRIEKVHELRVVMFGDHILAVRLDSQSLEESRLDWRSAAPNSFKIEEVSLPDIIVAKLREFCRCADVLHGSFDLAVTPNGDFVFFEFNPQGQSLWIEGWNPDIRVLDRLTQFIMAPGRDFKYQPLNRHSFADYLDFEAANGP